MTPLQLVDIFGVFLFIAGLVLFVWSRNGSKRSDRDSATDFRAGFDRAEEQEYLDRWLARDEENRRRSLRAKIIDYDPEKREYRANVIIPDKQVSRFRANERGRIEELTLLVEVDGVYGEHLHLRLAHDGS